MAHNQTRNSLCIQKTLEKRFRILLYICLNTKQIYGPKVLKIGSIIVPLPARNRVRLILAGLFFDRDFTICQNFIIFDT